MAVAKRFLLADLGGGLNQGVDATDIEDTELQAVRNFYPWQKRLIKRSGHSRVNGSQAGNAYFEETTSGFSFKKSTGARTLIVGGQTGIGKLEDSSLVAIPHVDSDTYTSSDEPWSFSQYKDTIYATRKNAGTVQRSDSAVLDEAGITAPSTAPTLVDGGAGNLPTGDYIGVVTFYNNLSGAESNPSDVSSTVSVTTNPGKITWSAIPISTTSQVTSRRLYRTLVGHQGVYYLVDEIGDNSTTTYSDNIVETSLGIDVSFDNGMPPVSLYNVIWQERLWTTDGTDLFYSELTLPESFGEFSFIQVSPDDGHDMRGLLQFGDKLIVGKTNKTYIVSGVDRFEIQSLSDSHGVYSHHSMKAAEGSAFWFGGDNFYRSDGNVAKGIGDVRMRDLVDGIDLTYATRVISTIDAKKGWYMSIVPTGGATEPDKLVVYNYRNDAWTIFDYNMLDANDGAPSWIAEFFDSNSSAVIYGNMQGGEEDSVFQLESGTSDDGRDITASFRTKNFGYDKEDIMKFMKDISFQASIVDQTADVSLYKDDSVLSDLGQKSYSMSGGTLWKRLPLANNGDPAVSMALDFSVTGTKTMEVLGLTFKIVDLERTVPISDFS